MKLSKDIYSKSKTFDPTLGPAINLWGFGEDGTWSNPPSNENFKRLEKILALIKSS